MNSVKPCSVRLTEGLGVTSLEASVAGVLSEAFQPVLLPKSRIQNTLALTYVRFLLIFFSAGTDCSCPGFVARGGAKGGGKPTNAKNMRIGIRQ